MLPHQLRQLAGGQRHLYVEGTNVREVIRGLDQSCPGLAFSICLETGELRPFVNVFVGAENIRFLNGMDTPVTSADVVHIIHSVAGG